MKLGVRQLCEKLAHFYWSPSHPSSYLAKHPVSGAYVGLGRIAHECYGSFNIAYLSVGRNLSSLTQHELAIQFFVAAKKEMAFEVDGYPLSSYLMLLTEREFLEWYSKKRDQIPKESCICIDRAFFNVHKLREI